MPSVRDEGANALNDCKFGNINIHIVPSGLICCVSLREGFSLKPALIAIIDNSCLLLFYYWRFIQFELLLGIMLFSAL